MKKLAKILLLVLSVALLVGALVVAVSANEETLDLTTTTTENVFKVYATEEAYLAVKKANEGKNTDYWNYGTPDLETNSIKAVRDYANTNGNAYVLLSGNWNEGTQNVKADGSGNVFGNLSFASKNATFDLNGYYMSLVVNRRIPKDSTTVADNSSQRMQANGTSVLTFIGNGGSIYTSANLVQFNGKGGTVNFEGGNGGLNIVAMNGYTYDGNTGELSKNSNFPGSEGIVKGFRDNAVQSDPNVVNILGEVNYVRESTVIVGFIAMYPTKGGFYVNIGKETDDASVRDTAVFTAVNKGGNLSQIFQLKDDKGKDNTHLTDLALLSYVNIYNATVDCTNFRFFYDSYDTNSENNKSKFYNATDDDVFTFNYINSFVKSTFDETLDAQPMHQAKVSSSYRINVIGSEIYTSNNFFNSKVTPTTTADVNTARAAAVLKDSYLSAVTPTGTPTTLTQRIGTVVAENCRFNIGSFSNLNIYWKDYNKEDTSIKWPVYAEELGGYGVYIKDGNAFVSTKNNSNAKKAKDAPGTYTGAGFGSNKLGSNGSAKWIQSLIVGGGNTLWNILDDQGIQRQTTLIYTFDGTVGAQAYDFEKVEGSNTTVKTFAGMSLCYGANSGASARPGKFTVTANPYVKEETANTYVVHSYWNHTEGVTYSYNQSYYYLYVNNSDMGKEKAANYPITDYAFYTIDIDLMTRTKFTGDFNAQFFVRAYNTEASIQRGITIYLGENGVWSNPNNSKDTYAMDYVPGEWFHVTMVLELPVVNGAVDYNNIGKNSKIHLFINGELCHTFVGVLGNFTEGYDPAKTGVSEVRISYSGAKRDEVGTNETALDNFVFARYKLGTDSTIAEAGKYFYSNYAGLGVSQPEDIPSFSYKGKYYSADKIGDTIFSQADDYFYGDDVTPLELLCDYPGKIDPLAVSDAIPEDLCFKYKANGYKLEIAEGIYVVTYDEETDVYTVMVAGEEDIATVTFDYGNGQTTKVQVIKGATISAADVPAIADPQVIKTTYADLVLNGWATKAGGKAITIADTVITEDVTLYPGVGTTVANMSIYSNLCINDNIGMTFYVPTEWYDDMKENIIDDFKVISFNTARNGGTPSGATDPTGKDGSGSYFKMLIDGKYYYRFVSYPTISEFDTVCNFYVNYEIVYNGETYAVTAAYSSSAMGYASGIIAGNYTAEEKTLVANYVRYAYEYMTALVAANASNDKYATTLAVVTEVYNTCKTLCTAYETNVLDYTTPVDASALTEYVDKLSVSVNGTRLQIQIDLKDGTVSAVSMVVDGLATDYSKAPVDGKYPASYGNVYVGSHSSQQKVDEDGYYEYYNTANILPWNFFGTFTITLTVADTTDGAEEGATKQVTGTYSLAAYYATLDDAGKAAIAPVFYALKEVADSVVAYRYKEVK